LSLTISIQLHLNHYLLLDFQKLFNEDYVVHLNSLMLNSGYELIVNENKDANIFLTNDISEKDLTIFQKNLML